MEKTKDHFDKISYDIIVKKYSSIYRQYDKNKLRQIFGYELDMDSSIVRDELVNMFYSEHFLIKFEIFYRVYSTQPIHYYAGYLKKAIDNFFTNKNRSSSPQSTQVFKAVNYAVKKIKENLPVIEVKASMDKDIVYSVLSRFDINQMVSKKYEKNIIIDNSLFEEFLNEIMVIFNYSVNISQIIKILSINISKQDIYIVYKKFYRIIENKIKQLEEKNNNNISRTNTKEMDENRIKSILSKYNIEVRIGDHELKYRIDRQSLIEPVKMIIEMNNMMVNISHLSNIFGEKLDIEDIKTGFIESIQTDDNEESTSIEEVIPSKEPYNNPELFLILHQLNLLENALSLDFDLYLDIEQYLKLYKTIKKIIDKKLTDRQKRIIELKLENPQRTNQDIAEILTKEGMKCDHSTVSRNIKMIKGIFINEIDFKKF